MYVCPGGEQLYLEGGDHVRKLLRVGKVNAKDCGLTGDDVVHAVMLNGGVDANLPFGTRLQDTVAPGTAVLVLDWLVLGRIIFDGIVLDGINLDAAVIGLGGLAGHGGAHQ